MLHRTNFAYFALGLVATLALAACSGGDELAPVDHASTSSGAGGSTGGAGGGGGIFDPGGGQTGQNEASYVAGPYGVGKGSTIANYKFYGYADAKADSSTLITIQLSDFYNPHGNDPGYAPADPTKDDRLYPIGSPHNSFDSAGKEIQAKKPRVLLVDVSSSWCPPCQSEAKDVLPGKYAAYFPRGGEFLLQLADGPVVGTAAVRKDLDSWTSKYKVDYPAAIDPSYKLGALFDQDAFPQNFIIDTTTMRITEVVAGAPDAAFWSKFEAMLDPAN